MPTTAPALANVPDDVKLDPENRALPIDTGDVCLNYDKAYFADHGIEPPASLGDLTRPEYKGLLVVENPSTSSTGLAFLLATVGAFGDPGYLSFWEQLAANDVLVVDGWETAYNTEFSGSSGHGAETDRRLLRLEPGVRGGLRRDAAAGAAHGGDREGQHLLPPDRVRRHPPRDGQPGDGRGLDRLHALADLPGGHAAADVRLPGQPPGEARPRLPGVPGGAGSAGGGRPG